MCMALISARLDSRDAGVTNGWNHVWARLIMAIDRSGPGITSSGRPLLVSCSSGITERTLDLNEAALLRMQPEEVRAGTKRGL